MAGPDAPVIIVIGSDALALGTAEELCALQGHRVVVLWHENTELVRTVEGIGAILVTAQPDSAEGLHCAGVGDAVTILALSADDQLNLHAALLARDANPRIRIVLRQFNRTLARKIEQNLPNCSVLSLARHSAATYAAAAVDSSAIFGLQFPESDGPLTAFAARNAERCGAGGSTVFAAEQALGARIVSVDGETEFARDAVIADRAVLVVYGKVAELQITSPRPPLDRIRAGIGLRLSALWRRGGHHSHRVNPILAWLAAAALAVFVTATAYFQTVFGDSWLDAAYFVVATMTTTGYGDVTPNRNNPVEIVAAMLLMLSGITLTGLFIAFGASLLTPIYWVKMQGLRPLHRRGHIIVCGAGSIGSEVIELLIGLGRRLVVIERDPDAAIIELARERRFDLLTGDASRDATLDLCNLEAAHGLVALTNVDTLNLEIGLGARARNPTMPIVLRIAEASFAASIARHFEFETTFSAAALAAPAFVGLSRFAGSRGRVAFAGQEFAIGEYPIGANSQPTPPNDAIVLAVSRDGNFALTRDLTDFVPGDRVLIIVPLAPFREGRDTLAAAAERFLHRI